MSIPPFRGLARETAAMLGGDTSLLMISRSRRNIEGRLYIWPPSIPGKHENDSSDSPRQHPWECWASIWKMEVDSHLAAARIQPALPPVRSEARATAGAAALRRAPP